MPKSRSSAERRIIASVFLWVDSVVASRLNRDHCRAAHVGKSIPTRHGHPQKRGEGDGSDKTLATATARSGEG